MQRRTEATIQNKKVECPVGIYIKEAFLYTIYHDVCSGQITNYQNVHTGPEKMATESQIKTILSSTGLVGLTFKKMFFFRIPDYNAYENHSIGKV